PDLVILPGTKNTLDDLGWLRRSGLEAAILQHAGRGGGVLGICGGYQMLGREIADPAGVEGGGSLPGLGLLPAKTVFAGEKTRTQVSGVFRSPAGIFASLAGVPFQGYEIHMGETAPQGDWAPLALLHTGDGGDKPDGLAAGNVWGCYVHGLFDRGEAAAALVNALRLHKGLAAGAAAVDWKTYAQRQYDKLAQGLRDALDMESIYRILDGRDGA
ncbi:MAG: cobyric acid synthase CobQ, partial [Oscillospiraceae bacterium]|nr:cobyric acid synthase CobQ [Oscillospiraceae bacterium]